MKKFLLIFFSCLLGLSLLGIGAVLLQNRQTVKTAPSTMPTTIPTTLPTEPPPVYQLTVVLNGDQDIYLEYGEAYQEQGAKAILSDGNAEVDTPVEIVGDVDISKIGTYAVTYTATAEGLTASASRNVHIVDTQLPIITLTVDPYAYTIPGQPYKEEGFLALDDYDGDITDQVTFVEDDGIITYSVTDSSGNTFTTQRTIYYFDPGKPNLKLAGDDTYLLAQGDYFADPGVTAIDKNDGDITNSVYVEGDVNPNIPGHYTLEYTATNSYNYSTTIKRTVIVLPTEFILKETEDPADTLDPADSKNWIIPVGGMPFEENGKTIYLTFDDGPSQYTEKLLDVLAKYDVKVSFFVKNSSYLSILERAYQEGHTVAAHTYSHDYSKIYANEEAFYADLSAIREQITKYTGIATSLLRFPGGSSNTISQLYNRGIITRLAKDLTEMGYTYFDWNVDSDDAGRASTAEEVFNNIVNSVRWYNNSVVLQHDTKEYSVNAVERVIIWGLLNGYTFAPLTEDSPTCHHPINN